MEIHLKIIGSLLIGLGLAHAFFPKYFNWKKDLDTLDQINKEMFYSHTFFIVVTIILMGLLSIVFPEEIVKTKLGLGIALGFAVFWTLRLLVQLFGYSSNLWKGKKFETAIHILFTFFWSYMSIVYWLIFINGISN